MNPAKPVCLSTHSPGVQLNVAVDVGCIRHRVAVGLFEGNVLHEFDIAHDGPGLTAFFARIEHHEREHQATSVAVAMRVTKGARIS